MSLGPFQPYAADLAPGDRALAAQSWESFELETIRRAGHPSFREAWQLLWEEFGARGEMERQEVIADRLRWDPARPQHGYALLYEMTVLRRDGRIVAVRDHTAIVAPALHEAGRSDADRPSAVVHLSHVLVAGELRGSGLAGWLRAIPVATAREALRRAGVGDAPVTLVAEMEHDDGRSPMPGRRLRSYGRAGFRMADPSRLAYLQPDFREPAAIDADLPRNVALALVLRRCGRERDREMPAAELRGVVDALHAMFAMHVRPEHMRGVRDAAAAMTNAPAVRLLDPEGETSR